MRIVGEVAGQCLASGYEGDKQGGGELFDYRTTHLHCVITSRESGHRNGTPPLTSANAVFWP